MEFIKVRFQDKRQVFIDGDESGSTNRTLRVSRGRHTIHLGDPRNYEPAWRRPLVTDTNPIKPMEVTFEKT